ncbi:MAG: hypothetical protein D3906_17790 [Candidatus Electrothrix sp. AUS1_2]|nr:hypothetical protein [Candidatus Electrothrix sp. AUS1_2]
MIKVISLKYGTAFKRLFSQPEVFTRFAQDVLGIELNIDTVHTEYEYPEPIGFVHSRYHRENFSLTADNRTITYTVNNLHRVPPGQNNK